jgi:hypothetical protein
MLLHSSRSQIGCATGVALAIALACALGVAPLIPPAPASPDAPLTVFSAGRAMRHVAVIAAAPHPIGSARQAAVSVYIEQQLGAIGLEPSQQETRLALDRKGYPQGEVLLRNIIATLPGTHSSQAVLLAAHYDSAPGSPGASDNGVGAATLLETARSLRASPRLANDVIVLFSDGEEPGLLGARAFMAGHPLAPSVGAVVNFDARGRTGPVVMFETAGPNLAFAQLLSRYAPYPVATSLSEDVYRRMPNTTDFAVFRRSGLAGINFAFFAEPRYYHNVSDAVENVDPRTLQHEGTYALSMTRALGDRALPLSGQARGIYFNVGRSRLLYYPASWALPLAVATLGLLGLVVAMGLASRRLTPRGLAIGTLAVVIAVACGLAIGYGAERWLARPIGARGGSVRIGALYLAVVSTLVAAGASFAYHRVRRRADPLDLLVPVHACWTLLAFALTIVAPGASYLFVLPAAVGVLAVLSVIVVHRGAEPLGSVARVWLVTPVVPALVLLTPALGLIYYAVGPSFVTSVVAVSAALVAALVAPAGIFSVATVAHRVERLPTLAIAHVSPKVAGAALTTKE